MSKLSNCPNFFIVGAARSATSTSHFTLNKHPQIFMSPDKEPNYFCDWEDRYSSWSDYMELFKRVQGQKVVGESSTLYLYAKEAPYNIKSKIKEPKILVQLRDPVERAISQYKRHKRSGIAESSFKVALKKEEENELIGQHPSYHYIEMGLYYEQVKRYHELFGRDRVKVVIFEDFISSPLKTLKEVCRFLEVDPSLLPSNIKRHNPGTETIFPFINEFLTGDSTMKEFLKFLLPLDLRRLWARKLRDNWNVSSSDIKVDFTEEEKNELRKKFVGDVKKVERLLGLDLSSWLP